jgi:hypothetical protein
LLRWNPQRQFAHRLLQWQVPRCVGVDWAFAAVSEFSTTVLLFMVFRLKNGLMLLNGITMFVIQNFCYYFSKIDIVKWTKNFFAIQMMFEETPRDFSRERFVSAPLGGAAD